jgi:flagellar biosynthesis/type III secretory pathway protein FliH
MTAASIARYLIEFDAANDASASETATANDANLAEAFAKGFESGKAAAQADLEELKTAQAEVLTAARATWAQEEGAKLGEQLAAGLAEIAARLAEVAASILKPFIAAELHGRAIADLVESLKVLLTQEPAAAVSISGAADLLDALRARLEGKVENVSYHPDQACDVRVTVGQTVLETRLGTWIAKIEGTVK